MATTADNVITVSVFDFAQTNKHKSVLVRADRSAQATEMQAHRWGSTSAITSIDLFAGSGNLAAGSTFSLYGLEG
jgi:hypothetical protein